MFPVAVPVASVVPAAKKSPLSSQINSALSPVDPRSITNPLSLALDVAPLFSSNRLSEITWFVTFNVTVVPLTVRSPDKVKSVAVILPPAAINPVVVISSTNKLFQRTPVVPISSVLSVSDTILPPKVVPSPNVLLVNA